MADAPEVVARRLAEFAATYPHLPLYGRITAAASGDAEVAALLTAARPGQARPVLLLAALHDLVLRSPDVPAARWFAAAGSPSGLDGDPWPDVRATLLAHADDLRSVIAARATQTNEVNRVTYVAALLAAACADVPSAPVALVELGASAGLLLALDRYSIALTPGSGDRIGRETVRSDHRFGDPASPVRCGGVLRSGSPAMAGLPTIVERVGLDLAPVALADPDEVRWLEACLWPDQPERLARFRAAVSLLHADPPLVVAGDMVDDLSSVAHSARAVATALSSAGDDDVHLVVMTNWALTYVARARRPLVVDTLAELAADGRPVSWLTAEPPGAVPGVAVPADLPSDAETLLAVHRWRAGVALPPTVVGHAHPHAPWLALR